MGHSKKLLNKIANKLEETYPQNMGYAYVFEKALKNIKPRMQPDIQIYYKDKLICVVEIGYTRPEKLNKYYKLNIQDIRWYSKAGKLCPTKEVTRTVQIKYKRPENEKWYTFKDVNNQSRGMCPDCYKEEVEYILVEKYGSIFKQSSQGLDAAELESVFEYSEYDVEVQYFSNGHEIFCTIYCDKCGYFDYGDEVDMLVFFLGIEEFKQFKRRAYLYKRMQVDTIKCRLANPKQYPWYQKYKQIFLLAINEYEKMYGCDYDYLQEKLKEIKIGLIERNRMGYFYKDNDIKCVLPAWEK